MDLENQYYNSKALKEDDAKLALESFERVNLIFCCSYTLTLLISDANAGGYI